MHIHTTARHCELDPEDRLFAEQRLGKLERFARDILEAHLIVTAEKHRHQVEITLRLKGHEIVSREESTAPRAAIDLAASRLETQLRKLKDRRTEWKRAGRSPDGRAAPVEADSDTDSEPELGAET